MNPRTGTSRKIETYGDAGVSSNPFGNISATTPNGTVTITWPTTLRQPLSPMKRCCRTFM